MTTTTAAAAGWYSDPQDPHRLRYWDGTAWTPHVMARPTTAAPRPRSRLERVLPWAIPVTAVSLLLLGGITWTWSPGWPSTSGRATATRR